MIRSGQQYRYRGLQNQDDTWECGPDGDRTITVVSTSITGSLSVTVRVDDRELRSMIGNKMSSVDLLAAERLIELGIWLPIEDA